MKKTALLFAAAAMSAGVFASPNWVKFSSVGPDTYADGTPVLDGEVYALTFTTNESFGGFNANGTPIVKGDRVIGLSAIAKDQHCPTVMYMLVDENANLPENGKFFVYLLDTRIREANAEGVVTTRVGGLTEEGTLAAVNGYDAPVAVAKGSRYVATEAATTAVASAVPANTVQPVIKAIKVEGAKVVVTVGQTVPFLQYGITAGETPSQLTETELVPAVNGTDDGDITLIVNDPKKNRFFKVTRK